MSEHEFLLLYYLRLRRKNVFTRAKTYIHNIDATVGNGQSWYYEENCWSSETFPRSAAHRYAFRHVKPQQNLLNNILGN